jgi:hypothetical protein
MESSLNAFPAMSQLSRATAASKQDFPGLGMRACFVCCDKIRVLKAWTNCVRFSVASNVKNLHLSARQTFISENSLRVYFRTNRH